MHRYCNVLDTTKMNDIDTVLQEFGREWIRAPGDANVIRITGPDSYVAIVMEQDNGYMHCYLWSRITGDKLGSLTVTLALSNVEEQLVDTLTLLHTWRELAGDCCRLPRELHRDGMVVKGTCTTCGSVKFVHADEVHNDYHNTR